MNEFKNRLRKLRQSESGAMAVEYAFIAAVMAAAVIPAISYIVTALGGNFDVVTQAFETLWPSS